VSWVGQTAAVKSRDGGTQYDGQAHPADQRQAAVHQTATLYAAGFSECSARAAGMVRRPSCIPETLRTEPDWLFDDCPCLLPWQQFQRGPVLGTQKVSSTPCRCEEAFSGTSQSCSVRTLV
ncbi:hypothetical protein Bbelb_016730, partial [Branchiostoma belcheri]